MLNPWSFYWPTSISPSWCSSIWASLREIIPLPCSICALQIKLIFFTVTTVWPWLSQRCLPFLCFLWLLVRWAFLWFKISQLNLMPESNIASHNFGDHKRSHCGWLYARQVLHPILFLQPSPNSIIIITLTVLEWCINKNWSQNPK